MTAAQQPPRLKVSSQVAKLVGPTVPRDVQLQAAREGGALSGAERLTALFFLCHSTDAEIRTAALTSARNLPSAELAAAAADPEQPPQLLNFIAQLALNEPVVIAALVTHPALSETTLLLVARRCNVAVLEQLLVEIALQERFPKLLPELLANPQLPADLAELLATPEPVAASRPEKEAADNDSDSDEEAAEEEELNLSKYQKALEMEVSAKIKMALTGDKEWRSIFLKDPNKLVHGAVLKNPRVTDGEVLAIAKNKTSSDEMIRIILLNREWTKNFGIKAALVLHPKTPVGSALRFMGFLDLKTLKKMGKSKGISQVLVNAARRMATEMEKKGR